MKYLLLISGGALGTLLRYGISIWMTGNPASEKFPWSTFTINLAGSFAIGILAGAFQNSDVSVNLKLFLFVGLLGGFTTFSSFAIESLTLFRSGEGLIACMYILGSNVIGIMLAAIGYRFGLSFINS